MKREKWIEKLHAFDDPINGLLTFLYNSGFQLEHVDSLKTIYELTYDEVEYIRKELTDRYADEKKNGGREYVCR